MQGEDRRPGAKHSPYDEASRVPLLVRGLGIAPGTRVSELAFNTHFYANLADIAGALADRDGRSLLPLLNGSTPTTWRKQLHLEDLGATTRLGESGTSTWNVMRTIRNFTTFRTTRTSFRAPKPTNTDPALVEDLKAKLEALKATQDSRVERPSTHPSAF
jgi:N-acetylglucosamine-6-sulfatase